MNLVEAAWQQLAASPPMRQGLSGRRIYLGAKVELFAALDRPSDTPIVFANLRKRTVPSAGELPASSGFEVRIEACEKGPAYVRVLLRLSGPSYRDVFSVLAEDVLACMADELDDDNVARVMFERLRRWQDFLQLHGPNGLGELAQRGLFGELWFLREYALPAIGASAGVGSWSGPERANQDFQFSQGSVEVKTTAANPHHEIKVSNVRQLDETSAGALILLHVALEARQGTGESLEDIVASIRSTLGVSGLPLSEFEAKLRVYGYLDTHAQRYRETRFVVHSHDFYRVASHFPRLLERDLPVGVGEVTYSVALSACSDFLLATAAFTTLLQEWNR